MRVPVDIGRDEARRLAEEELRKAAYRQHEPSQLDRLLEELRDFIVRLLNAGSDTTVSGWFGILIVVALVVLVVLLVGFRAGRIQRSRKRTKAALLDATDKISAAQQRLAARDFADAEEWAEAIRARMRAIALGLEERALLDRRLGRTADEVAREAAVNLPGHADELGAAARVFDDVWYGDHEATRAAYDRITRVDERVRDAKPSLTGAPA